MHRNTVRLKCLMLVTALLVMISPSGYADGKLTIYTVNYPLQYFSERIAGDHARVVFPAPPDVDPAFWMPDHKTISEYQQADMIVLNGAGYARWVSKVSLPRLRQVDTSKAFQDGLITIKDSITHGHGPDGQHSHRGTAFVIWLDLYQAVQQAQAITEALSRKRPDNKADFEKNFTALRKDLMALDLDLQRIVNANPRQRLFASHPVYHYLARRYELPIEDMVWEPDEVPDEQQWIKLRQAQEHFPAGWMLWEKQPLPQIVQQLEDMGIDIVVFDPCANLPASGDFLSVMRENVAGLGSAYTN